MGARGAEPQDAVYRYEIATSRDSLLRFDHAGRRGPS